MVEQVEEALDRIRPMLQMDGGDVELLGIEGGVVRLRLIGACGGCPMSSTTLKVGIERSLRQAVPGVEEVVSE
ncbi:MAG: NifU family protein [bacterium]